MKSLLAAIFAIGILSGCALTTDHIDLSYTPQQGITPLPDAIGITVNAHVVDQRQDKSKVSAKKNGYGMEMAPIIPIEDVAVTIRRAIEQELQSRGFKLAADNAVVQIAAELTRFYNDHKRGFFAGDAVADLNMNVIVKSPKGDLLYSKQINVQGTEPNTQLASGENAKLALNRALENGMRTLFEDKGFISALLNVAQKKIATTN